MKKERVLLRKDLVFFFLLFASGGTRQEMKSFWSGFKKDPSVKEMLLDTDASKMDAEELSEVLSLLPEWKGKRILELGGGIG